MQDFCAKTPSQNPGVGHRSEDSELNSIPKKKRSFGEKCAFSRNESKIKLEDSSVFA